jgi:hypothetical protein
MAVNKDIPKKRGRPATGKDPMLTFRCPPALTETIEHYANAINKPRSEAIRRLVEKGLAQEDNAATAHRRTSDSN